MRVSTANWASERNGGRTPSALTGASHALANGADVLSTRAFDQTSSPSVSVSGTTATARKRKGGGYNLGSFWADVGMQYPAVVTPWHDVDLKIELFSTVRVNES